MQCQYRMLIGQASTCLVNQGRFQGSCYDSNWVVPCAGSWCDTCAVMPGLSRRCWYMRVSFGDWSMHDVRSVCFVRGTLNCNYGPAVIDVGKGGREKSIRRKRAYWVPYVEWLGAVWSYGKCWKLCWKLKTRWIRYTIMLVDFDIKSCWSVLCAMFHRTSNGCWLVLCAMFHRTSNDLERCGHTTNAGNYA